MNFSFSVLSHIKADRIQTFVEKCLEKKNEFICSHDFYIIYLCCYLQKIDCLPSIPTESFTFPGRNSQRLCGKAKGRHTHTTNTMHARLRRTDGQLVKCKPFQIFNTLQLQSMFYDLDGMYQRLIKLVKLVQPSKGESSEMAFVVRIGRLGQTCIATN